MTAPAGLLAPTRRVLRAGRVSLQLDSRTIGVSAVVAVLVIAVGAFSLSVGDFPIPVSEVVPAVLGVGESDAHFIVHTLRLPRLVTAILVGAAFGLSGAIFQSLARNPLASPDIIGVNAGAALAALVVIVLLDGSAVLISLGALVGALATATAIYALAYRRGVTGYRLVLVGIGVTAVLSSATSYLLTQADIFDAQRAAVWLTGSLNARGWDHVRPVSVVVAVLVPATLVMTRQLRLLQLGDDAARGLGARVEGARGGLLFVGVVLAAVATASAGPVAFVALVAPQIARRLVGGGHPALGPAALTGAAVVVIADLVGRRAFAPIEMPVGIITAVVGAPYLLWLLARTNRGGVAG